jgi:hypothetical protein
MDQNGVRLEYVELLSALSSRTGMPDIIDIILQNNPSFSSLTQIYEGRFHDLTYQMSEDNLLVQWGQTLKTLVIESRKKRTGTNY